MFYLANECKNKKSALCRCDEWLEKKGFATPVMGKAYVCLLDYISYIVY